MDSKKTVLLIVLGLGITAMTIAFAALSTNLRISGTASVPNTNWNIHFANWALDTASTVTEGGITHQNTAEYPTIATLENSMSLKPNVTKVENIDVTLYQPGDYAKYTFQIINEGSIDASLDSFTHNLTCASGNDCSHLSYTVECVDSNNNNVLVGHPTLAKNGGLAYCTLQVKYLDQTNTNSGNAGSVQTYTQSAAHATLDATWVYVQKLADNSGSGSGSGSEPVAETWDKYYYYDDDNFDEHNGVNSLSDNIAYNMWIQENTTSNKKEVCHEFPQGTVCIDPTRLDHYEGSVNPTYYDNIIIKNPITTPAIYDNDNESYYCEDGDYDENNNICVKCSDYDFTLDGHDMYYYYDSESGKCHVHNYSDAGINYDSENNKYYTCPESAPDYDYDSQKCLGYIYPENGYSITKYNEMVSKGGDCSFGTQYDSGGLYCYGSYGTACSAYVPSNEYKNYGDINQAECHNYDSLSCTIGDPNYDDSCH